jgi:hypothetical protein
MNRVDQIIRYLSGELTEEESGAFEKEMSGDKRLREEFDNISTAYKLIRDQIRQRDEDAFRSRLKEVIKASSNAGKRAAPGKRPRWYLFLSMAASVAILLAIILMNRDPEQLYRAYYHPGKDPVILAFEQDTRGDAPSAISLFGQGKYEATLRITAEMLELEPGNQLALLFHLLAAMELGQAEDALERVEATKIDTLDVPGQSITWYHALANMKSGHTDQAINCLNALAVQPGPYRSDARRLQKLLSK